VTDLQIIGGGRMGEALLGGLLAAGREPRTIAVVEPVATRRDDLVGRFPGIGAIAAPLAGVDAVIAVKPHLVVDVAATLAALDGPPGRVLSIAAGVTLAQIEAALPAGTSVVRAMPNTPSLVGSGAAAVAPGSSADEDDLSWAESLLVAVGIAVRVTEAQLDAVTGLSGSGPAYLFLVAEAMTEAGVMLGLPRPMAEALAGQTIMGAGRMLTETDDSAAELRAAVTSPGGTTAAGLRALEDAGVRAALLAAVEASAHRSAELSAD
jgi:pyrroline-5-carboxylate reductase